MCDWGPIHKKKSLLDIVIISNNLVKYVDSLEIDVKQQWTPCQQHKGKLKYPDHYALKLTFKGIPTKELIPLAGRKSIKWNTRKKGGWESYKSKTDNNLKLIKVREMDSNTPDKISKAIEKELTSVKFASFGKIELSSKNRDHKSLNDLQRKKDNIFKGDADNKSTEIEQINKEIASTLKRIEGSKFKRDPMNSKNLKRKKENQLQFFP